jgi:hypothetical protein
MRRPHESVRSAQSPDRVSTRLHELIDEVVERERGERESSSRPPDRAWRRPRLPRARRRKAAAPIAEGGVDTLSPRPQPRRAHRLGVCTGLEPSPFGGAAARTLRPYRLPRSSYWYSLTRVGASATTRANVRVVGSSSAWPVVPRCTSPGVAGGARQALSTGSTWSGWSDTGGHPPCAARACAVRPQDRKSLRLRPRLAALDRHSCRACAFKGRAHRSSHRCRARRERPASSVRPGARAEARHLDPRSSPPAKHHGSRTRRSWARTSLGTALRRARNATTSVMRLPMASAASAPADTGTRLEQRSDAA